MTAPTAHTHVTDLTAPTETADLRALRAEVRQFLHDARHAGAFEPRCDSWLHGRDPAFSRELGSRGWIGMTWPTRYGGGGRSPLERFVVTEELLAAGAPVAAHWFADRQTGPLLLRYGTEVQRQELLPAIAQGECFFAIGMSEPGAGSDLASVETRAVRDDGGWRVTGRKVWSSHASHSHFILVLCRTSTATTDRHDGLSQFIVDLGADGVTIEPIRLLTGDPHFDEVTFEDVFVADDRLVGAPGQGWVQVTSELALERSGPERFMSVFPLLAAFTRRASDDVARQAASELNARLWCLRQMSAEITRNQQDADLGYRAAIVKELGTRFEQDVAETIQGVLTTELRLESTDELIRHLAECVLLAPTFTLRGGTTEILQSIIGRELLR